MDTMALAHRAKQTNERKYAEVLVREFGRPGPPRDRQFALARAPFRAFVTLNYDPLLRKSLEITSTRGKGVTIYVYPHLPVCHLGDPGQCEMDLPQHALYHIHGRINHDTTVPEVVLTPQEYHKAYDSTLLPSFLTQLLAYFPTCFLGCSLSEDAMLRSIISLCKRIQKDLAQMSPHPRPKWYMLIDRDEFSCQNVNLDEYGITPVLFNKTNKEFEGLDQILKEWAGMQPATESVPFEGTADIYMPDQEPSR